MSYGKYIAWYCEVDVEHSTSCRCQHPFRYIKEDCLERNEAGLSAVCGYVYDNEVTRQIIRHLGMPDAELRNDIAEYTTGMEYRAKLIKCLWSLRD